MEASILKDAIEKIQSMSYDHFYEDPVSGNLYYDTGTRFELIEPPLHIQNSMKLRSLDALVTMVQTEAARIVDVGGVDRVYVSVPTATSVEVFTTPRADLRNRRIYLCDAEATDIPGFRDTTYSYEQAVIALRSRFAPSEDQAYVLDLMSHLVSGQEITTEDDGITQQVRLKAGIQMVKTACTRPIVRLRPYRTFQEIEQPESEFLIRLDEKRNLTITEADGGMWKLAAREIIKKFLEDKLSDEIESGAIYIAL